MFIILEWLFYSCSSHTNKEAMEAVDAIFSTTLAWFQQGGTHQPVEWTQGQSAKA